MLGRSMGKKIRQEMMNKWPDRHKTTNFIPNRQ